MLTNYLKIAFRSLRRRPGYTGINVVGLAVGMACCLLILTFARNEWAFDRFHVDAGSIYRVNIRAVTPGDDVEIKAGQPIPLAPQLAESFDGVVAATRMMDSGQVQVRVGDVSFEEDILYTDASFFDVFTFPIETGNPETALSDPGSVVLSTESAERLFGSTDALGRSFRIDRDGAFRDVTVSAVVRTPPSNSSIQFDLLLPVEASDSFGQYADTWSSWVTNSYVRLNESVLPDDIRNALPGFAAAYYEPMIRTWRILKWIGDGEQDFGLTLQPLTDVHFSPDVLQSMASTTDPRYPGFLLGLAVAVLLIASINFTTLSIGRAARRAREVGMRKVLGAPRGQLIRQFFGEALLMSFLAMLLALALTESFLPAFSNLVDTSLSVVWDLRTVLLFAGIVILTAFLAGTYPSLYLSGFKPVRILKGATAGRGGNRWMQALVVLQFTLSIAFIIAVLIVSKQLRYLQNKDLGFDEEQVVVVETPASDPDESIRLVESLKSAWMQEPNVLGVAASSSGFNRYLSWSAFGSKDGEAHTLFTNRIDRDFVDVMGLEMDQGQAFSADFPSDTSSVVLVNEALVREFGWDDPIGEQVNNSGEVVGVIADYNFQSLHLAVEPMLLSLSSRGEDPFRYMYVRLSDGDPGPAMERLSAAWSALRPANPFTWYFLDDDLDAAYQAEQRVQRLISAAALFAVMIACLGLFGLAAYAAERRTREIGIRKVVGASSISIVRLLSMEFVGLVGIAVLLATPLAWIVMQRWLDGFAYRVDPGWSTPVLAAALALLIALVTVAGQAFRAANTDPVNALRYE